MNRSGIPLWPALLALAACLGSASAQVLVATNSVWSYRKGTAEASSPADAWRTAAGAADTWTRSAAPFYYDTSGGYAGNTPLNDMRNGYVSLFLRRTFQVGAAADVATLGLRHLCDDGFVLWINGTPVTAYNKSPANVAFDSLATSSVAEPIGWLGETLTDPGRYLRDGENVIAVQAFNASRTSSDFLFDLELTAAPRDLLPPVIVAVEPPPGDVPELNAITVTFSEPVTAPGFSDLLVNDRPATGVRGSGATYVFSVDPPAPGPVRVRWDAGVAVADFGVPANRFDPTAPGATWEYRLVDRIAPTVLQVSPLPGITVRRLDRAEVLFSEPVTGIAPADLELDGRPATAVTGDGAGPYVFTFDPAPAGNVTVRWRTGHAIRDLAAEPNAFAGEPWSVTVDPGYTVPPVRISEFLAGQSGNLAGLADEDDELPDWIELHNRGAAPVSLAGWSLTDEEDDPGKWVFPDVTLPANGRLVVFASGKDRRDPGPGRPLHTNFRLGLGGEFLGLFNAESPRVRVMAFAPAYPPQRNDIAYGYNGRELLRHFPVPTPGAANGDGGILGLVPDVGFSPGRGLYAEPFQLTLTNLLAHAVIRFTLDGSEPGPESGQVYAGPISVTNTAIVRAAAFAPDRLPSASVTHTFVFPARVASQPAAPPGVPPTWVDTQGRSWTADYGMDPEIVNDPAHRDRMEASLRSLPVLSLVTRPQDMFDNATGIYPKSQARGPAWERPASVEFLYADPADNVQANCGVQMQGNSVRDPVKTGKHAFRLVFKRDYGPPKLVHRVFPDSPVDEFDTLTVRADFNNSWMHWDGAQRPRGQRVRDAWMKASQRAMGGLASHSRLCHLFVNGLYWGVYDPVERPDAAFAQAYFGGRKEDFDVVNEGQLVDGSMTAYNAMRALTGLQDNAQYERMKQYLDVPAYIDYVLLHFYAGHQDWFTDKNWYAIRRRAPGEGFRYQSWDGELMLNGPGDNIVTRTDQPSNLHPRLLANAQYRLDFADRVQRHLFNGGALTPESAAARYAGWADRVGPAMLAESARWGDYRRDVHAYSSGPFLLHTPALFAAERDRLLTQYFPVRTANVLAQLRAAGLYPATVAPTFSRPGGPVPAGFALTVSAPAGTVFYTTDGSDPRTPYTGALAPAARAFSGPLILNAGTVVRARVRNVTEWSALTEAVFEVGAPGPALAFTEIHYHPPGGDPYEFVELQNHGPLPVNAGGFSLGGIGYVFPPGTVLAPGQVVVLASALSPAAFAARHPGVPVLGHFDGSLDNGGERLTLCDRDGRTIVSADYDDSAAWPQEADGDGASLEILDPRDDPDAPASWRASSQPDGTPGRVTPPPGLPDLRLDELMAGNPGNVLNGDTAPDWVELVHTGTAPADLSGWQLLDSGSGRPFIFPAGTRLGPGARLVLWCDAATHAPGLHTGFGLDRQGESLVLSDPRGRRIDAVTWGHLPAGLTLTRLGTGPAWHLGQPTPGQPGRPQPLAEPAMLALNEWLADAPPGGDDWIELFNRDLARPLALHGLHVETATARIQIRTPAFLGPRAHLQLSADERPGPGHLDLRLPAAGGFIRLLGPDGTPLEQVDYGLQAEGISLGRLPDGSPALVTFPDGPTPGAANRLGGPLPGPPRLGPVTVEPDGLRIRLTGTRQTLYRLERSTSLAGWTSLGTTNAPADAFDWTVPVAPGTGQTFLRALPEP